LTQPANKDPQNAGASGFEALESYVSWPNERFFSISLDNCLTKCWLALHALPLVACNLYIGFQVSNKVRPALALFEAVSKGEFGTVTHDRSTYLSLLSLLGNHHTCPNLLPTGVAIYRQGLEEGFLLPISRKSGMLDLRGLPAGAAVSCIWCLVS